MMKRNTKAQNMRSTISIESILIGIESNWSQVLLRWHGEDEDEDNL